MLYSFIPVRLDCNLFFLCLFYSGTGIWRIIGRSQLAREHSSTCIFAHCFDDPNSLLSLWYSQMCMWLPIQYVVVLTQNSLICFVQCDLGVGALLISAWVRYAGTSRSLPSGGAYALLFLGQVRKLYLGSSGIHCLNSILSSFLLPWHSLFFKF